MLIRRLLFSAPLFITTYIFQETVLSQLRLPGGGFSILMILALTWAILSEVEVGAVIGFFGGFLMDLSQSSTGPFGLWTFIMLIAGFVISYIGNGHESNLGKIMGVCLFIVVANLLIEIAFLLIGSLLGISAGSVDQIVITLFGMSAWTLLVSPLFVPLYSRMYSMIFNSRSFV